MWQNASLLQGAVNHDKLRIYIYHKYRVSSKKLPVHPTCQVSCFSSTCSLILHNLIITLKIVWPSFNFQRATIFWDRDLVMIPSGSTDPTTSSWRQSSKELASTEHSLFTPSLQVVKYCLCWPGLYEILSQDQGCPPWQAPLELLPPSTLPTTILYIPGEDRLEVDMITCTQDKPGLASTISSLSIRRDTTTTTCQVSQFSYWRETSTYFFWS